MRISTAVLYDIAEHPGARAGEMYRRGVGRSQRAIYAALHTLRRRGLVVSQNGYHWLTAAGADLVGTGGRVRPGPLGPRPDGSLRSRAWRLLRIRRRATISEILEVVSDGQSHAQAASLAAYCAALARAGILARTRSGAWALQRDLGPAAPAYCARTRTVRDPHTGAVWQI